MLLWTHKLSRRHILRSQHISLTQITVFLVSTQMYCQTKTQYAKHFKMFSNVLKRVKKCSEILLKVISLTDSSNWMKCRVEKNAAGCDVVHKFALITNALKYTVHHAHQFLWVIPGQAAAVQLGCDLAARSFTGNCDGNLRWHYKLFWQLSDKFFSDKRKW